MSDPTERDSELSNDCALTDEEVESLLTSELDRSSISVDRDEHIAKTEQALHELRSEATRKVVPSAEIAALFASTANPVLSVVDNVSDSESVEEVSEPAIPIDAGPDTGRSIGQGRGRRAWIQRVALVAAALVPLVLIALRAPTPAPPQTPTPASAPSALPTGAVQLPVPIPSPTPTPEPVQSPEPESDAVVAVTPPAQEPTNDEREPEGPSVGGAETATPTPTPTPSATSDGSSITADLTPDEQQVEGINPTPNVPSDAVENPSANSPEVGTAVAGDDEASTAPTPDASPSPVTAPEIVIPPRPEIPTITAPEIVIPPRPEIPTITAPEIVIPPRPTTPAGP